MRVVVENVGTVVDYNAPATHATAPTELEVLVVDEELRTEAAELAESLPRNRKHRAVCISDLALRRQGRRRSAEAGLVSFGLLSIGVAIVGPLLAGREVAIPVVVVLAFVAGAAYAATTVSAQTALFEHMPPAVRGRVFGVLASIVSAASLLPILIAGPLADKVSAPVVLSIVAAAVIATGVASAQFFGPREPGPDPAGALDS